MEDSEKVPWLSNKQLRDILNIAFVILALNLFVLWGIGSLLLTGVDVASAFQLYTSIAPFILGPVLLITIWVKVEQGVRWLNVRSKRKAAEKAEANRLADEYRQKEIEKFKSLSTDEKLDRISNYLINRDGL